MRGRWLLIILLAFLCCSCATCRNDALRQAEILACKDKPSRVAVYYIGAGDQALDLWMHDRHAQAQTLVAGKWLWIGNSSGEIEDKPEKDLVPVNGNDYLFYSPDEFRAYLRAENLEPEKLPCEQLLKKGFPWKTMLLILLLV